MGRVIEVTIGTEGVAGIIEEVLQVRAGETVGEVVTIVAGGGTLFTNIECVVFVVEVAALRDTGIAGGVVKSSALGDDKVRVAGETG